VKSGGLLRGDIILPELIRRNHAEYVAALQAVDASLAGGNLNLAPLHALVSRLLDEQLQSADVTPAAADTRSTDRTPGDDGQPQQS
jgi:hypothetical protein